MTVNGVGTGQGSDCKVLGRVVTGDLRGSGDTNWVPAASSLHPTLPTYKCKYKILKYKYINTNKIRNTQPQTGSLLLVHHPTCKYQIAIAARNLK